MPKKKKPEFPIPSQDQWQTMFAGMNMSKNGEKYFKPTKDGWSKIFGDIDLVPAHQKGAEAEAKGVKKNYMARFLSPMSGVMQTTEMEIKPEQRYEVSYQAATNSSAGFLATTVTFLNSNNTPLGIPSSGGVKLSTLETGSYSPISFATCPAPEGAVKAQLSFVVFGLEADKYADIDTVSFKVIS
ncbi:hypothetical protein [Phosphitispora fastidiosa]|uniref:hypothetical protein n=1 Tax=Phosphitispora fastidiosa TaxID=2837202 RepID=UPI001E28E54C|nr:hypothetical protein [Phosphitispora fastidiosa]MBU7007089.1 hypothetical protein [Phosphitispora fastidiosa]